MGGTSIHDLQYQDKMALYSNPNIESYQEPVQQQQEQNINKIVEDINDELEGDDIDVSDFIEEDTKENKLNDILNILYEPTLLVIIYVILSQSFARVFIGRFIKQINPNDEGVVGTIGLVIYGYILAIVFVLCKRYIKF